MLLVICVYNHADVNAMLGVTVLWELGLQFKNLFADAEFNLVVNVLLLKYLNKNI